MRGSRRPMPKSAERSSRTLVEASVAELSARAWRLIDGAQAVMADLDGCLAADNQPLPGAAEFVARVGARLVVASNNSTHTATELAALLASRGLSIAPRQFVLAGELAVGEVARQWPEARLMLLGSPAMRDAARAAGLRLVSGEPDVVLVARALQATVADLQDAVAALHHGARLVVANPDLSHPGENGLPRIETGALLTLLRAVLPGLPAQVVGKPEPTMFRAALAMTGADAGRAVMLGDNPTTDVAGARRIGMQTIRLRAAAAPEGPPNTP
ncbi:MAG: HAD hydrolase-like protein [Burkholderiales bacterium]|nr:MAG: HAD hydrolase-like protein [Burkholderiales bacterium]